MCVVEQLRRWGGWQGHGHCGCARVVYMDVSVPPCFSPSRGVHEHVCSVNTGNDASSSSPLIAFLGLSKYIYSAFVTRLSSSSPSSSSSSSSLPPSSFSSSSLPPSSSSSSYSSSSSSSLQCAFTFAYILVYMYTYMYMYKYTLHDIYNYNVQCTCHDTVHAMADRNMRISAFCVGLVISMVQSMFSIHS